MSKLVIILPFSTFLRIFRSVAPLFVLFRQLHNDLVPMARVKGLLIIRKILSVAGTERHLKTRKAISIGCQLCFIVKSVCSAGAYGSFCRCLRFVPLMSIIRSTVAYESFRRHLPLIGDGGTRAIVGCRMIHAPSSRCRWNMKLGEGVRGVRAFLKLL